MVDVPTILRWIATVVLWGLIYTETGPFTLFGIVGLSMALEMNLWLHNRETAANMRRDIENLKAALQEMRRARR